MPDVARTRQIEPTIDNLPLGFRSLISRQLLSSSTVQAIHRVQSRRDSPATKGNLTKSAYPSIHRALSPLCAKPDEGYSIDFFLFLALMLYSAVWHSKLHPEHAMNLWCTMTNWVRWELTNRLLEDRRIRTEAEENCLLWIWHVAIGSWRRKDAAETLQADQLRSSMEQRFPMEQSASKDRPILCQYFPLSDIK